VGRARGESGVGDVIGAPGMRVGGNSILRGASVGVGPVRWVGAAVGSTTVPASTGITVASLLSGTKGLYAPGVTVAVSSTVLWEQEVTSNVTIIHV